jgi:hypothetical protein
MSKFVPLGLPKWFGNSQMREAEAELWWSHVVVVVVMVTQLAIEVMVAVVVEVDE